MWLPEVTMGLIDEVSKTDRPVLGSDIPILVFRVFRHFSAGYVEEVMGRGAGVVFQNGGRELGKEAGAMLWNPDPAEYLKEVCQFVRDSKIGLLYPINDQLQTLLGQTLTDSRWDMPYLGMQVLIEGLALAAFGLLRDVTTQPLPKQILAYVMQDEARHVAFGRMALRDYYRQLTDAELREREDFVIEGCYLMRDRIRGDEVWENFGIGRAEIREISEGSAYQKAFRSLLFSRLVPCVRDIGLWSDRLRQAYADMGVLDAAKGDLDALMRADEDIAERLDQERFAAEEAARADEVTQVIDEGAAG